MLVIGRASFDLATITITKKPEPLSQFGLAEIFYPADAV